MNEIIGKDAACFFITELKEFNHDPYDAYLGGLEIFIKKETGLYRRELIGSDPETVDVYEIYREYASNSWASFKDFLEKEFSSQIRGSGLVLLFSIFETNLVEICNFCLNEYQINLHNIAGRNAFEKIKNVFKSIKYTVKRDNTSYQINENIFENSTWRFLLAARKFRHYYAHNNGCVKEENITSLRNSISSNQLNTIFDIKDNFIFIQKNGLNAISKKMLTFYDEIFINV